MAWGSAALGLASIALLSAPAGARDLVVHAGTLIDGVGQAPSHDVSIVIHDDRIVAVEPGFQSPAGTEIVDLSHETVMPGFIDVHVHISSKLPSHTNATEDWLTHSALDRAFDGAVFARQMLQQGFTSARDLGGGDETVAVRDAIDAGKIDGPRLVVVLAMTNFANAAFCGMIETIATFHETHNAANLDRFPIRILLQRTGLQRLSCVVWWLGSGLMLYGIWFDTHI